jgi:hypothetical protein
MVVAYMPTPSHQEGVLGWFNLVNIFGMADHPTPSLSFFLIPLEKIFYKDPTQIKSFLLSNKND